MKKKKILFVVLFAILGFVALQIPVSNLAGSKATFNLFDAFSPTAGAFLGSIPGIIAVFLMKAFDFLIKGAQVQDIGTLIRFVPPLFAVIYFAKRGKLNLIIPVLAIIAFNLHPIGRSVWYYSLYWLIPIVCNFFHGRSLIARSLGATFTAHAVGGALWIYFFNLPQAVWIGLIPIVALERTFFAVGMALAYIFLTNVIYILEKKKFPQLSQLHIQKEYVWKWAEAWAVK